MKKILFIISSLDVGGAEKILTTLANHFSNIGYEITILIASKRGSFFPLNRDIEVRELKRVKPIFILIRELKREILSINPDIIISFMSEMNILATIASKLANKPIVVSERSAYDFLDIKPIWKKLRRVIYPFVDGLVVLTNADRDRYHFVKNRYKIENPLILKNRHSNIKREKIILAVGRLNPVKGFDILIRAFSKIKNREWRLRVVGEGAEREKLEILIDKLDLKNRVELVGLVKDVEIEYKRASIFVLSSRTEGFPGVLCEAMGYGCAVISFDCPSAPREIIRDRQDGLLVESNNIEELTSKIDYLIDNPKVRDRLGFNAKKISKRFSIDMIGIKWFRVIDKIVKEG